MIIVFALTTIDFSFPFLLFFLPHSFVSYIIQKRFHTWTVVDEHSGWQTPLFVIDNQYFLLPKLSIPNKVTIKTMCFPKEFLSTISNLLTACKYLPARGTLKKCLILIICECWISGTFLLNRNKTMSPKYHTPSKALVFVHFICSNWPG